MVDRTMWTGSAFCCVCVRRVFTPGHADLGFALGHDLDHGDAVDELGFALNCSAMPSRSVSFAATMPLAPVREWAIVLAASIACLNLGTKGSGDGDVGGATSAVPGRNRLVSSVSS
jgi:hypothetical protein